MGITALVVLAWSLSVAAPAPLRLVAPKPAFINPMFQAPQAAHGVSGLIPLRTSPAASAARCPRASSCSRGPACRPPRWTRAPR